MMIRPSGPDAPLIMLAEMSAVDAGRPRSAAPAALGLPEFQNAVPGIWPSISLRFPSCRSQRDLRRTEHTSPHRTKPASPLTAPRLSLLPATQTSFRRRLPASLHLRLKDRSFHPLLWARR